MPIFFRQSRRLSPMLIGGVLFLLDRMLKFFALAGRLPYFFNTGLVFSLPVANVIAIVIATIILLVVAAAWLKNDNPALLLIMIGGTSNLLDRLRFGGVIDYIFIIPTAPANLADLIIAVGILWFVWSKRKNLFS